MAIVPVTKWQVEVVYTNTLGLPWRSNEKRVLTFIEESRVVDLAWLDPLASWKAMRAMIQMSTVCLTIRCRTVLLVQYCSISQWYRDSSLLLGALPIWWGVTELDGTSVRRWKIRGLYHVATIKDGR